MSSDGLVTNAILPLCQIHEWMPSPFCEDREKYGCDKESVRKVWSTECREPFSSRWFWLCREDAELVEEHDRKQQMFKRLAR